MKFRTQLYALLGLLVVVLGFLWFYFTAQEWESIKVFDATINRDCAPWDGAAFTLSIPDGSGAFIDVSIWQSPDFIFPVTFSFPDQTGRVGNAVYRSADGSFEALSGKVFFWRVEQGIPVEGEFNLVTGAGQQFKGKFKANWGDFLALCG
jgi:hypothetical protein